MEPTELYLKLLTETARVRWSELTALFARGALIRIAGDLDLVSVAEAIATDESAQVAAWAAAGLLEKMPADLASGYEARDAELWAVVVSPWVVVQERPGTEAHAASSRPA
ncbi:DUF2288 family protein [Robbsia sp. Bb-Pol-6]|uniref:DUF2288 family protein n=1 Tax=Robbsia betulipollinis TaxID=2981849 RepID=A0ABT3ZQB8_9BURK|nr:DUF2288 family protein [Robbsia betulipollinis]